MAIKVSVYGADKDSDEYNAALKLKKIIQDTTPDSAIGEIVLFASATLYGQAVKDVDLMMLGSLQNYNLNAQFNDKDGNRINDTVSIQNFCTVIEIKRHDISGIVLNGTDFYVKYGGDLHCVTQQSNKQKISAMNFFISALSFSPFITNIIWFTQATSSDIDALLVNNGRRLPSNVIGADFDFKDILNLLLLQKPPFKTRAGYIFDSNYESCGVSDFQKALQLFSKSKEEMGELTRRRIEMISNKAFQDRSLIDSDGKVSIYRGRAGTGKTVGLIQTAIYLVDEKSARVLLLTYNKALVSDIRRLFALGELPDMFEENCVAVNTMQSYFYRLVNKVLYDGKMSGDKYLSHYEQVLAELNDFLSDPEGANLVKEELSEDSYLDWDYLLIDEAQDWNDSERDIVLKLFDKGKIIVADGGNQFVRRGKVCDWTVIRERNNIKLKYCLRQKENIISFLNLFTVKMDMAGGKILSSDKMPGGRIRIIDSERLFSVHDEEMNRLIECGNIAYDMLYLVPHALVKKDGMDACFSEKKTFEQNGIFFWDGTNSNTRENYSVRNDEVRVLQYDSARGLEGWTVVCVDFDIFINEKSDEYIEGEVDSLLLESPAERKKKYMYNWMMIPLTRAIDTLVITLRNPDSKIGQIIRDIAEEHNIANEMGMTEDAVRECMLLKTNILTYYSLNAPVGEEEESELGDFIPAEDVLSLEDIVASRELRRRLEEVLGTLKDREQQVLRMRFGLDDGKPRTLEDVGHRFGVTRERIRQIEAKALRKLRHPSRIKKLKGFL